MKTPIDELTETVTLYVENQTTVDPASVEGTVEYPPDEGMADLAVNWPMKAANQLGENPRTLAEDLAEYLSTGPDFLADVEVAGAGFVNCTFRDQYLIDAMQTILDQGQFPFQSSGDGESVLLEFVSANPTGPLHVGHGRGAIYGDVLGRLLEAHGYDVQREYYVNDTGEQIRRLGESLRLRAEEHQGQDVELGDDHYKGEYVSRIVREENISPEDSVDENAEKGVARILEGIFGVLDRCDIDFDSVVRESEVARREELDELIRRLREADHVYDQDGAVFLATSEAGDDKDRVLIKENGDPTYFANDLVYHHKKFEREYDRYVDVWGHDHHGYQDRVRSGLSFLGHPVDRLEIKLYQLVDLYRDGEPVSMSTREGDFVPLEDLVEEVGTDAVRFNFLTKNHDRPLDFDIEVATREDEENPVYYVQYAHTRMASIRREAPGELEDGEISTNLTEEGHNILFRALNGPRHLNEAIQSRDPHRVVHYLLELARKFHSYYGKHPVIDEDHPDRSRLRLRFVAYLQLLIGDVLDVIGVDAPESM
jgi:arginyl-tRNA synthetase